MFLLWMQTFSRSLWFDGSFSKLTLVYRGWLSCIFLVGTRYVKIVSIVQLSFLHLRNANVDISTCLQWGHSRTPASWGAWNYYLTFFYENVQSQTEKWQNSTVKPHVTIPQLQQFLRDISYFCPYLLLSTSFTLIGLFWSKSQTSYHFIHINVSIHFWRTRTLKESIIIMHYHM